MKVWILILHVLNELHVSSSFTIRCGACEDGGGFPRLPMSRIQLLAAIVVFLVSPLLGQAPNDESGFVPLFDGKTLAGWKLVNGHGPGYIVRDNTIVCPKDGGGNLFTEREYANFVLRFEFKTEPGGNSGIGIRAPYEGTSSVEGMEIQILDDGHEMYRGKIKSEQHHGSVYDMIPARTGFLKPAGEWNSEEIVADGRRIRVPLNGAVIVDASLDMVREPAVLAKHPGITRTSGHIGLLGHDSLVEFRNLRIKTLP